MRFLGPGGKESKGANHREGVRGRCRGMSPGTGHPPPFLLSSTLVPAFGCQTQKSAEDWESWVEMGWGH